MKKYIILSVFNFCFAALISQASIGINNTNPQATLDIRDGDFAITNTFNTHMKVHKFQPVGWGMVFTEDGIPRLTLRDGGNIGIGGWFPDSRLEVNGSTDLRGPIKLMGVAGQAGQVLGINQNNQPAWMPMQQQEFYDNADKLHIIYYDSDNFNGTYTVPAGVTKLLVELWGGGGGGNTNTGGGGGGYLRVVLNVQPGEQINYNVGGGGSPTATGGSSSITFQGQSYTALGGGGSTGAGTLPDPEIGGEGGAFIIPSGVFNSFGVRGEDGEAAEHDWAQTNTSSWRRIQVAGNGGSVAHWPTRTGGRGTSLIDGQTGSSRATRGTAGKSPGGGGGAGYGGQWGGPGLIIFKY